ncbi:MAG: divalent-cation tolerance protein CutA [Elusimicrobia bacterium HGW-Elusimicrobia-1]|jgi:periplasmic divalent cation tolerance protein|nr:MAG: divalent-cation tolerance protein CutA [Elusimicrobia bacterium HGW-Elusimicrobia-3]PKN01255.1 MAG: divalent-cation tolerance protein CutA [Elusimicrobia bacterium HGW-Elusimicrobia-1]
MSFIIIYITNPDIKTAKKIASHLLKKRLIACANFFPIESSYWWKGKIETAREVVAIVKTRTANWQKVRSAVEKLHPYETPCIMKIPVTANADFEKWIKAETR